MEVMPSFMNSGSGTSSTAPLTVYRYERKYLSDVYDPDQLEQRLLMHPDIFRPAFVPRQIWTLYFDTPEYEYYQQNLLGQPQRVKARVRWYSDKDNKLDKLQIELKRRDGEVMLKLTYPFQTTINDLSLAELTDLVRQQLETHLEESGSLQPALLNHYQRRYFTSAQNDLRITIDSELHFATITDWENNLTTRQLPITILEAKYPISDDTKLPSLAQGLPLRVSKSSKFVMGMQQCHPNDVYYH